MNTRSLLRRCRPCTACCTLIEAPEISKMAGQRCPYENDGCGAHSSRPKVCQAFTCAWRGGTGQPNDRPDLVGAMVTFLHNDDFGVIAKVYETRTGAITSKSVRDLELRWRLCEQYVTIVHKFGNPADITIAGGPEPLLTRYLEASGQGAVQ